MAAPKKALAKKAAVKPKSKTAKKPAPKKPQITNEMFQEWFYKLKPDEFIAICNDWNDVNLKIKIPKLDGYDEWLNYFKSLSPTVIKKLATTGVDFLPTDGYAALSRWHDIVKNPHRIDKIHQAGLTKKNDGKTSITEKARSNDRLGVLHAIRDRIAEKLEKGAGARDTAALAREMTDIMSQIADLEKRQGPKRKTKLGELLGEYDLSKRPAKNGSGARQSSFKSRITIKDREGVDGA